MLHLGASTHVEAGAVATPITCSRCGLILRVVMPVPVDTLLALVDALQASHRTCKKPKGQDHDDR